MDAANLVLKFLGSIGRPSEAEFYLNLFLKDSAERFAVIVMEPGVLRGALDAVLVDLRVLSGLGLCPVVVVNAGTPSHNIRWTRAVEQGLTENGVRCTLTSLADTLEPRVPELIDTLRQGVLPIVSQPKNELEWLGTLVKNLASRKVLFLRRRGALERNGAPLPIVNLTTEFSALLHAQDVTETDKVIVRSARHLIFDLVEHSLQVAVTSPFNMLKELFTTRGDGTLLRRGATIARHDGFANLDIEKIRYMFESSFDATIDPSVFLRKVSTVYLENAYRGGAVVQSCEFGGYLTKFAVTKEAQGEGLGRDLWQDIAKDYPKLLWRARNDNAIIPWYMSISDGVIKTSLWHVFFRGIEVESIPLAVRFALDQPVDLVRVKENDHIL